MADETIQFGQDGPAILPMGIGTWSWGDAMFWGYGNGTYNDQDIEEAFQISIDAGITFFDTAEVYGFGKSEKILGKLANATDVTLVTATKYFPYPFRFIPSMAKSALKRSLKRLKMDKVELYQVHWPAHMWSVDSMMSAMADNLDEGLTDMVGVSNYNLEQTRQAHEALNKRGYNLTSNQVEFSLIQRKPETSGLLEYCKEQGITLIAYSPLGMGMLTGKYTPENPPTGVRARRYSKSFLENLESLIGLMKEIGEGHGGKTPAQVAINWVTAKGALPIPGAKNAKQARDNLGALDWSLSAEEVTALDSASTHH